LKLRFVCRGKWSLYAICDDDERTFLDSLALSQNQIDKLLAALERLASLGQQSFTSEKLHHVCEEPKIYQLRKGNLRILWFYSDGNLMICCNAFEKRQRKTPQTELDTAIALHAEYIDAVACGNIEILDEE
jgi:hypothetical protein